MKKLIGILCLGIFLGACASVSNVDTVYNEPGKRPTLSQIHKNAELIVAALEDEEKIATLSDEGKEFAERIKNWEKVEGSNEIKKYAERPITSVDILTMAWALDEEYTMEDVDKFLKLGLYVKNPYCENEFKSYEVFQVLPDIVLTHGCEITSYSECSTYHGKIFMFFKQKDELYFDKKVLAPSAKTCPTMIGIYTYEANNGMNRTVPVLTFLPKTLDKAQLENIQKLREESQKIFE